MKHLPRYPLCQYTRKRRTLRGFIVGIRSDGTRAVILNTMPFSTATVTYNIPNPTIPLEPLAKLSDSIQSLVHTPPPAKRPSRQPLTQENRHSPLQARLVRRPTETPQTISYGADYAGPPMPSRIVEPVGQQSTEHNIRVPLYDALIVASGFSAFIAPLIHHYQWPWTVLIPVFTGSFLVRYIWRSNRADSLLRRIEEYVHIDLNGDGQIGDEEEPQHITVFLQKKDNNGTSTAVTKWPLSIDTTLKIIDRLQQNNHYWSRAEFCTKTKTISQGQFAAANDYLTEYGFVEANQITDEGYEFFQSLLDTQGDPL